MIICIIRNKKHIKVLLNHILYIVLSHLSHSCHNHFFQQEFKQVLLAHIWYLSHRMAMQHNTALENETSVQAWRCVNDC